MLSRVRYITTIFRMRSGARGQKLDLMRTLSSIYRIYGAVFAHAARKRASAKRFAVGLRGRIARECGSKSASRLPSTRRECVGLVRETSELFLARAPIPAQVA